MRARWRFLAFLVVLIGVMLMQVESTEGREEAVTLPDGSRIRLLGTTYGTTHRWIMGNAFSRSLFSTLPEWMRGDQGDRWGQIETSGAEATVAWFMHDLNGREPSVFVTLFDDRGNEIPSKAGGYVVASGRMPKRRWMIAVPLSPYPFYSRYTGVHFWSSAPNSQHAPLAGFRLPRSPRDSREAWKAEPLPLRQKVRDLECTLKSWEQQTTTYTDGPPASSLTHGLVRLVVSRKGVSTGDWWLSDIHVRDEAGGVVVPGMDWLSRRNGTYQFELLTGVWPEAAAYDLEVGLCPMPQAVNASIKVTRPLAVLPAGEQSFKPVETIDCDGTTVGILRPIWNFNNPTLMLRFTMPYESFPASRIVVTKIVDDVGKVLPLNHPMHAEYMRLLEGGRPYTTCIVSTRFEAVPQAVTATFALVHSESVRFRVKPSAWKPPPGAPAQTKRSK